MSGFNDIFNEQGAVLAVLGAMGGMVRALALRTTWREGLRVTIIGSLLAFGVGVLSPVILRPWIGEIPDGLNATFGVISASAFIIGLLGITLMETWLGRFEKPVQGDDDEKA